jgi:CubicO group peptidase (beta-lactamase class C family)
MKHISYPGVSFLFLFLSLQLGAQRISKSIDSLLSVVQAEQTFGGEILVAEKGRVLYNRTFGLPKKERIFNLASISKTFTAVAVLQLAERQKLKLDDELTGYFPQLPYPGVTIRNMLSHTSGLPDFMSKALRGQLQGSPDNTKILSAYASADLKPQFGPDSSWAYSNTNFLALAGIVEKVSGLSYPDYLKKFIFEPAGMRESFVLLKNAPADLRSRVVTAYNFRDFLSAEFVPVDSLPSMRSSNDLIANEYGDGGVYSTAEDLLRFHEALMSGKILSKKFQHLMYSIAVLSNGKSYEAGNANRDYTSGYGMGWIVARDSSKGKIVWHSGADPGLLTFFMRDLDSDECVIVLNNRWYRGTYYLGGSIMNVLNGKAPQMYPPSLAHKIGITYTEKGSDFALRLLDSLKKSTIYHAGLAEMNDLGYTFLNKNDFQMALAVFRANTEIYPGSGDVWDSLGEAEYKAGDKAASLVDYEHSLKLDPGNAGGKTMIEKIRAELHL